MTLSDHRRSCGDATAAVLPDRGVTRTYRQIDDRSMQLARRLHAHGLRPGDHIAVLLDNDPRWFEIYWAAVRSGLYVTPVAWHLDVLEVGHIVEDCGASVLVTSARLAELARSLGARRLSKVNLRLVTDGDLDGFVNYEKAVASHPALPLEDEREGAAMFYSSGTTGRPKGVLPPLTGAPYGSRPNPLAALLHAQWGFDTDTTYLCSLPLYHSASLGFSASVHRLGGTVVVMDGFDPLRWLELIERHRVTHVQLAPIHFVRLLELDPSERSRCDLTSLRVVLHAGVPCPVEVKRRVMAWLGPIVHEYYIGVEANGVTIVGPEEWLKHPGTVGRPVTGAVHIVDEQGNELPPGCRGQVWFDTGAQFEYHHAPEQTAAAFDDRGWSTLGDVGYVDDDGYLYLTGRASEVFTIAGTTVYPQEIEDLLLAHPAVADVAVLGVADADHECSRQLKVLVQVVGGVIPGEALALSLVERCRVTLSEASVPRSIVFVDDVGRLPTGKLHKRSF
jgi:acyl-CoA synthetase (AMP-forming)/AMP-acid ligase II